MKAVAFRRYGDASVEEFLELPDPIAGAGQVVVRVIAAGVNPVDWKQRAGELKSAAREKFPAVMGVDFAGVVESVGAGVTAFQAGDAVFGMLPGAGRRGGAFAERLLAKSDWLARKPSCLSFVDAAVMPCVSLTAWLALVDKGQLQRGQTVLIHGAAGGVGSAAVQIARRLGATVIGTASDSSREWLQKLGVMFIDYRLDDFAAKAPKCDLILDTQGGEVLMKSCGLLKPGGAVISTAGPPEPSLAKQLGKGAIVSAVLALLSRKPRAAVRRAGGRYVFVMTPPSGAALSKIAALAESGALSLRVDKTFPFSQAKEAIAYAEAGKARGKVAVTVDEARSGLVA